MLPIPFVGGLLIGLKRWPTFVMLVIGWAVFAVLRQALAGDAVSFTQMLTILLVGAANALVGGIFHEGLMLLRRLVM